MEVVAQNIAWSTSLFGALVLGTPEPCPLIDPGRLDGGGFTRCFDEARTPRLLGSVPVKASSPERLTAPRTDGIIYIPCI